ncbi:hypothetical protein L208DRAFT_1230676 [Tricholoma matsutake]|nr:hypothetical protein L208DRAFT_1230676 [Tricholoma matsutake 945]
MHGVTSSIKPDGNPNLLVRKMAIQYEIPQGMLNDRWNGTPNYKKGHAHELLLTAGQEEVLI